MSTHTIEWAGKQQPIAWQVRTGTGASRHAVRYDDPRDAAVALLDGTMARMLCIIGGKVTIGNGEAVAPVYDAMDQIRAERSS